MLTLNEKLILDSQKKKKNVNPNPWKDKKRMIHKKGKKWKESFKVRKLHCVDTDNISNVIKRQLNQQ